MDSAGLKQALIPTTRRSILAFGDEIGIPKYHLPSGPVGSGTMERSSIRSVAAWRSYLIASGKRSPHPRNSNMSAFQPMANATSPNVRASHHPYHPTVSGRETVIGRPHKPRCATMQATPTSFLVRVPRTSSSQVVDICGLRGSASTNRVSDRLAAQQNNINVPLVS